MYSQMLLVFTLLWVSAVRSVPRNRVVSAELVCTDIDMQLHIVLERPIRGTVRAFVKERSEDLACSHLYSEDGDHNALVFKIPLGTCSMQKTQQSVNRFSFTTTVYFSFHSLFVSKDDVAYRITCDYAQQIPETMYNVTAGVGVREIEESNADERSNEDVECSYSVRKAGSEIDSRDSTAYANLGDEIVHEWSCAKMLPTQFIFVHDCIVNPEFDTGNDPVIVDSQGFIYLFVHFNILANKAGTEALSTTPPTITQHPSIKKKENCVTRERSGAFIWHCERGNGNCKCKNRP
uniref:OBG-type G domain-containing protein n=1 Tax=Parascaris univalens TaxID=6257 RepID=A0A915B3U7_PARUN